MLEALNPKNKPQVHFMFRKNIPYEAAFIYTNTKINSLVTTMYYEISKFFKIWMEDLYINAKNEILKRNITF